MQRAARHDLEHAARQRHAAPRPPARPPTSIAITARSTSDRYESRSFPVQTPGFRCAIQPTRLPTSAAVTMRSTRHRPRSRPRSKSDRSRSSPRDAAPRPPTRPPTSVAITARSTKIGRGRAGYRELSVEVEGLSGPDTELSVHHGELPVDIPFAWPPTAAKPTAGGATIAASVPRHGRSPVLSRGSLHASA